MGDFDDAVTRAQRMARSDAPVVAAVEAGDEAAFGRLLHAALGEEHPEVLDQVRKVVWQRARRARTTTLRFTDTELDELLVALGQVRGRTDVVERVVQRLAAARRLPKGATRGPELV